MPFGCKKQTTHHALWLQEANNMHDSVTYDAYLADFTGGYHDIRNQDDFANCMRADDYTHAQALAKVLLEQNATGIVYYSARTTGDCLVCFRPNAVDNVRKSTRYRLTWSGTAIPEISVEV